MPLEKIYVLLLAFLLVIPIVKAEPVILPIINKDEFQSCLFGWCQTVAPAFLFTDLNLTFANYSYISVYSNYTNISNYSSYANNSFYFNGFSPSYFYPYSNPFNFINTSYNSTYDALITDNASWNESHANTLYASKDEPLWLGNYSVFNTTWSSTYNASYLTSEVQWEGNYSSVAFKSLSNVSNNTLFFNGRNGGYFWNITGGIPFTNLTGYDLNNAWTGSLGSGNITITKNLNMSIYNTTRYLSSASVPICTKDYNSTGALIWCDCYNNTHKWMANTC